MPFPKISLGLLALACSFALPAHAATSSSAITNTATLTQECELSVTQNLDFGIYDPLVTHRTSAAKTTTGMINIRCTGSVTASVNIGGGLYYPTTFCSNNQRRLRNADNRYLTYKLSSNGADEWEPYIPGRCGVYDNDMVRYNVVNLNMPVYGRINGGQVSASAGQYTDSVVVSVHF